MALDQEIKMKNLVYLFFSFLYVYALLDVN